MIRSIRKPLIKEWTSAGNLKQLPSSTTRSFSRCRHGKINLNSSLVFLEYHIVQQKTPNARNAWYSTVPDRPDMQGKADVPPPSAPAAAKTKIDLRPAPKKVTKDTLASSNPPPPPSAIADRFANSTAGSSSSTTNTSHTDRIIAVPDPKLANQGSIEATKYDLAEARRIGILSSPPEGTGQVAVLWHNLKQIFWFYYGGVKTIFVANRQEVAALQKRVNDAKAKGEDVSMTRREARFVRTYKQDILRLLPFIVTVLLLEEAIPVVVLYAPALLPSTCLLPTQRDRIRAKRRAKQLANLAVAKTVLKDMQPSISVLAEKGIDGLPTGLTPLITGIVGQSTWFPTFIQRMRLQAYLTRLALDDAVISKEDMGARLNSRELVEALEARGIVSESALPYNQHFQKLQWWLKSATDSNTRLGLILQYTLDSPSTPSKPS